MKTTVGAGEERKGRIKLQYQMTAHNIPQKNFVENGHKTLCTHCEILLL